MEKSWGGASENIGRPTDAKAMSTAYLQWVGRAAAQARAGASMSTYKQLRLGAFMRPVSIHTGAWRYPGAIPDANFNFGHIVQ